MDENRKKAYRKLLKYLVDSGRAILYHKQEYNQESIGLMGDYCYLMHNLVNTNYQDNWDEFTEVYFWNTFEFLKQKSSHKDRFDNLKKVFSDIIEKEVTPYLLPIYNIIKKSFEVAINQHQYEGLIVFLYDCMSLRNIGKLLSYFIDKHETIITADIDKYYNADKANYNDVKEHLDQNGFAQWVSTFDFQVNNSFVENEILYVEGRFVEGQIIHVNDKIHSIRTTNKIEPANMIVVSIEMYKRQIEFLDIGMTARLGLRTDKTYELKENTILSSELIDGYE